MEIKTSWDLSPLLQGDDDNKAEEKLEKVKQANESFVKKWCSRDDYLKSPEILKQALDDFEYLIKNHGASGDPGFYFTLRYYQNQDSPKIKAKLNKIEELEKELSNKRRFFILNISKIPEQEQKKFLNSPLLNEYKHFLEKLFERSKHLLSESEEKILALKESTSHDYWERMTQGLLNKQESVIKIEEKKQTKNFSELLSLTEDHNKKTREIAAEALNKIFVQYAEVAEPEINAILANKKIDDELRKFPRADSARHLGDDISTEIVDTLIQTITKRFDISKKFYELKAKLLKVNKIKYYERNVPYSEQKISYPFEKAVKLVQKTFENLDPKFFQIFSSYLQNNQIDAFPKKGKQNGAFCMHQLPIQPTFILLNHTETLKDVTTLAHELGHGINNELMKEKQNALNIGTPKSTAEVASTFMEDFVLDELLKEADNELKLAILMERLSGDVKSIFRQIAFYNFETDLHKQFRKKGYLSKEEIGSLFKEHMESYMGDFVETSEAENWWIYVPHFRFIFYVYSYASGLLISKALQSKIKENPRFIEKVKKFLSAGTSDSPVNIFKNLGIDISSPEFWLSGINEISIILEETEKLAKKLGKVKLPKARPYDT